jgi:hypothetical protein
VHLGIPRTGALEEGGALARMDFDARAIWRVRGDGSPSESSESAKRLRNAEGPSSSSDESANLLERFGVIFCFEGLDEERPNPRRKGDFALEGAGAIARIVGVGPEELRIDIRICVGFELTALTPPLLNGRRIVEPVGDKERRLNRLDPAGES